MKVSKVTGYLLLGMILAAGILFFVGIDALAEDVTITTYYPAPYGVYVKSEIKHTDPLLGFIETDGNANENWRIAVETGKLNFTTVNDADVALADRVTFQQNGNVGIGTTNPGAKLDVNSNTTGPGGWNIGLKFSNNSHNAIWNPAGGLYFGLHSNGDFHFGDELGGTHEKYVMTINSDTGNITSACPSGCSDKRSKTNIKDITNALDVVTRMRGVSFNWKNSVNMSQDRQIGFIGQEMEKILPEVVTTGEWNGIEDYKSIKYDCIVPVLAEAIKELKTEKDALKQRIEALEAKLR